MEISGVAPKVQAYLTLWAPELLGNKELVAELEGVRQREAIAGATKHQVHDAIHTHFVAWCAVAQAELPVEGAGATVRLAKPKNIWGEVVKVDRFASAEFAEYPSANQSLDAWYDARLEEVMEVLRFRLGTDAEAAIDLLAEWLQRGFDSEDRQRTEKIRRLVELVRILREHFGTANRRPEFPKGSKEAAILALLREGREQVRKENRTRREESRNLLARLKRS